LGLKTNREERKAREVVWVFFALFASFPEGHWDGVRFEELA